MSIDLRGGEVGMTSSSCTPRRSPLDSSICVANSDVIYAGERDYSALVLCPIRKAFLHITRGDTLAQFRQKKPSSSLPNRSRKSSQCSIHATRCDQSAGGALCCLSPLPTLHRLQVEVFDIQPHQLGKTQTTPYITSSIARSRTARGSLISYPAADSYRRRRCFSADDAALRCRNTFRRVSFEFVLADQPAKKLRSAESRNARLAAPSPLGDCVQQNCAPSLHRIVASFAAVFAGKIDDRLKLTLVVK